jgi:Protein of unknown function (DUF3443)
VRKLIFMGLVQVLLVLGGCGGGGGGASPSSNSTTPTGSGSGSTTPANVVTMTVDAGPDSSSPDADMPFVTVTVCKVGSTTNCVQIPDVEVDTGSYGLRIISSVLSSSFIGSLTQVNASNGSPLVECTQFVDGISWGPIMFADVYVGGELASSVPIQVMGDSAFENEIPSGCLSNGSEEDTVSSFGANGIIGVGPFAQDCGSGCVLTNTQYASDPWYYGCPSGGTSGSDCQAVGPPVTQQVANPVAHFTTTGDDNGVIIELPSVPDPNGAVSASGSLVFGIGTESNNALGSATVLTGDPDTGDITTSYTGTNGSYSLPDSYLDTGSNAYYFDAATMGILDCQSSGSSGSGSSGFSSSWLCPTTEQTIALTNEGENDTLSKVNINIYNANTLLNEQSSDGSYYTAFDNLGADTGSQSSYCQSNFGVNGDCYFDLGLPFFFGRNVFVAIAGENTSAGEGPYFAY